MKIRSLQAVYPEYRHIAPSWRTELWQIVVRVETDTGVVGYGSGGGGRASVPIVNGHFRELLAGRSLDSADDISKLWDHLYRESIPYGRGGIATMALSGVDLALWDALGKAEGVPVAGLLGGASKRQVRCYATGPETEFHAEAGFTASKRPHRWSGDKSAADDLARWAEESRRLLGPEGLLMIDTYMSWDFQTAEMMARRLREFSIHWFEDVLTPDQMKEQSGLRTAIGDVNLAGGEHELGPGGFSDLARRRALDIWQPDITWCGGITAGLRIVELARETSTPVVPHRGGEAWALPLITATDCENLAEVVVAPRDAPVDRIWEGAPEAEDGMVVAPDSPGFGVKPVEGVI